MFTGINYSTEKPAPEELLEFYRRMHHETTHSREKIVRMLKSTFCVVTARRDGELVGMARGVTDGLWGRLAECKLDPVYQGPACITKTDGRIEDDFAGIAREMAVRVITSLREYGAERVDAVAYGTEVDFCEELGFKKQHGLEVVELLADAPIPAKKPATANATA